MLYERCLVCNEESFGERFCSDDCEAEYNNLMEEVDESNEYLIDEHAEDERMRREDNLK